LKIQSCFFKQNFDTYNSGFMKSINFINKNI